MLPRLAAIVMISLMLFGMGGYSVVFKLEQISIRERVKERIKQSIPNDQLHHFTVEQLSKAEWEDDHEFSLEGIMYDVVRTTDSKGVRHFYCLKDGDETRLVRSLNEIKCAQDLNKPGKNASNLLKFFCSLDFYPSTAWQMAYMPLLRNRKMAVGSHSYCTIYLSVNNPPPWILS